MAHHATLSADRWSDFTLDQQILMIGNELNRASKWTGSADEEHRRSALARALTLTDLTIVGSVRPGFRRELLRWRDVLASLYISKEADPVALRVAFRTLLRLTPETSRQIAYFAAAR